MDQERFLKIVKDMSTLEGLKDRLENAEQELKEAEIRRDALLKAYNREEKDVDRLQRETLSSMLARLVGRFDEKLDKETQEMLEAKLKYDSACSRVEELKANRVRLVEEISRINRCIGEYKEEFQCREQLLMGMEDNSLSSRYRVLKTQEKDLSRQLVELSEAIRAASAADVSCSDVLESLDSADSWATYDIWSKGGLLSHMAKYDHLDRAQEQMNRLNSNLADMSKELRDVNMVFSGSLIEIDRGTRAFDFWFDNIFTDMSVRNTIEENIENVENLRGNIKDVIGKLGNEKKLVENRRDRVMEDIKGIVIELGK